jgi:hypothetical protein
VYADPIIEPTIVRGGEAAEETEEAQVTMDPEASLFSVTENGELIQGKNDESSTSSEDQDSTK